MSTLQPGDPSFHEPDWLETGLASIRLTHHVQRPDRETATTIYRSLNDSIDLNFHDADKTKDPRTARNNIRHGVIKRTVGSEVHADLFDDNNEAPLKLRSLPPGHLEEQNPVTGHSQILAEPYTRKPEVRSLLFSHTEQNGKPFIYSSDPPLNDKNTDEYLRFDKSGHGLTMSLRVQDKPLLLRGEREESLLDMRKLTDLINGANAWRVDAPEGDYVIDVGFVVPLLVSAIREHHPFVRGAQILHARVT